MIREFATYEEAEEWMLDQVDDPCIDNIRFAFADDAEADGRYNTQQENGCCGFFDEEVIVDGKPAMIGCNYGH